MSVWCGIGPALALGLACTAMGRDPWLQPFASDSIWNTALGSEAIYVPAALPQPGHIGCDVEWMIRTRATDPILPLFSPSAWTKRWPGERLLGELRVPPSLVIPDADPPHTPNACAAFLMPDGRTVRQIEPACRPSAGPRIVGWLYAPDQDLYGRGIGGAHFGSGLSVLGGSIRKGELVSERPLTHALKLNIWGKWLYFGTSRPGFRWPADRSDSYAKERYHGSNPALAMGSLLALPPHLVPPNLAVETEVGLKIFAALQDYGAYVSDDSAWDAADVCVEHGVPEEVSDRYGYALTGKEGPFVNEMKRMVGALMVVDNNSAGTIGGGGQPRQPPASELVEPPSPADTGTNLPGPQARLRPNSGRTHGVRAESLGPRKGGE